MKYFMSICAGLLGSAMLAGAVLAQSLELPAPAQRTFERVEAHGSYALPIARFSEGRVPTRHLSGAFSLESWRLGGGGGNSNVLMENLAAQLAEAGYEVLFQCADDQCGGFDFRFGIKVVSEPHMRVDLGDFQFLSAHRPSDNAGHRPGDNAGGGGSYATLLGSRSPGAGFVQIARMGPAGEAAVPLETVASTITAQSGFAAISDAPLAEQLEQNGYAVLADLVFATGSAELGDRPYESLTKLAAFLATYPERRVALVGHTDAEGSLDGNIALSKRRAASVRRHLIDRYAVAPGQMASEGVGFLAPLTSNLTEEGRAENRRVEVVLTSTR